MSQYDDDWMHPQTHKDMNCTSFPERLSHLAKLREGAAGRLLPIHSEDAQAALDRIEALEAALKQIASCESHAPGDVVDIARKALI